MRRDIRWRTKREDGTFYEIRVSFFGGKFKFQYLESVSEQWDYVRAPSRDDVEKLVDALRRRYQRRQVSEREVQIAEKLLNEI